VKQIEIVGTRIAPEFSSSLVMPIIMVRSIASIVVWSRWGTVRNNNTLVPAEEKKIVRKKKY
jgi:hypothetical protein